MGKATYNDLINWLNDETSYEPSDELVKYVSPNMLVSIFSEIPWFIDLSNTFLNNWQLFTKVDKKEILQFIKYLYKHNGLGPYDIKPLFVPYLTKNRKRKPQFVKDYEMPIIDRYIIDPSELYKKSKKIRKSKKSNKENANLKTITLQEVVTTIPDKNDRPQCKSCGLFNGIRVLHDSNSPDNVYNCDVMFVGEAPGETETKLGKPFVGRAGQKLRQFIQQYLKGFRYYIANVCLCRPDNNRTPTSDEIEACAPILDKTIETVQPKIIVALGSTAIKRFNIDTKNGVTKLRKTLHEYKLNNKTYKVFCTVHPSYIIRGNNNYIYEEDFEYLVKLLSSENDNKQVLQTNNVYSIRIPDKYYTDDYSLVDIQSYKNNVYYIFKNRKTNQKEFYTVKHNDVNYAYISNVPNDEYFKPVNQVSLVKGGYFSTTDKNITLYESDIYPPLRHFVDYLTQKKDSNKTKLDVLYVDIEVASKNKEFPLIDGKAKYPISIISFRLNDTKISLVNEQYRWQYKPKQLDGYDVKYGDEEYIIKEFAKYLRKCDIVTAWNISFDLYYIIDRYQRVLKRNFSIASPLGLAPVTNLERNYIEIPGIIVNDLLTSYKSLTYGNRDFYSLNYIAKIELGEEKLEHGEDFGEIFKHDLERALHYNIDDVEKIYKLNTRLGIIDYFNELRNVACVPWKDTTVTSKLVEGTILQFCKKFGLVMRSYRPPVPSEYTKLGGYVKTPDKGIKPRVFLADFKSLYPSIIMTFNIGVDTLLARFEDTWDGVKDYVNGVDRIYTLIMEPHLHPHKQQFTLEELRQYLKDKIFTIYGTIFTKHENKSTIMYPILTHLLQRRVHYKKLMKSESNIQRQKEYNNIQRSYKEVANSVYGYHGFDGSKIYNTDIVNSITATGQFLIKFSALYTSRLYNDNKEPDVIDIFNTILNNYWIQKNKQNGKYYYEIYDVVGPNITYTDTDSVYFDFDPNFTIEQLESTGLQLLDKLNNEVYPHKLSNLFNYSDDKNYLLFEYEALCSGYWIGAKKRYAYKDLNTGKIVIKGLEINRSDFSQFTKDLLSNLLKILFDTYESKPENLVTQIEEYIRQKENEAKQLIDNFDKRILKSVSYGASYKKIPSHVIGMMLWNILNNRIDFRPGNKGYQIPIKFNQDMLPENLRQKVRQLKLNTGFKGHITNIAIPEEISVDELKQFFSKWEQTGVITVDKASILNFAVYQRVLSLLEGIADFSYLFPSVSHKSSSKEDVPQLFTF